MAEEVDQASIDVIKTLLESKNGKIFFNEYLYKALRAHMNIVVHANFGPRPGNIEQMMGHIRVNILYNGLSISESTTSI